jgi:hypothetical protein
MDWLLFMPQLPAKPDYLRVKLGRRLARLGAISLRSGVHVLPHQGDCLEDLAWLRQDLRKDAGDAIICTAALIAGTSDEAVVARFNEERSARYRALVEEADAQTRTDASQGVQRLRRRLKDVVEIDFFDAPGRADAEAALRQLETRIQKGETMSTSAPQQPMAGATWVTRGGVKVDRIASAWLIRRFIDPRADIRFVDPAAYVHAPGELRFDMFEGEYTHQGDYCTFETLVAQFSLHDAALRALAEIVHDIDVKDSKYERPETAGISAFINGLVAAGLPDDARLEQGFVVFDALYRTLTPRA